MCVRVCVCVRVSDCRRGVEHSDISMQFVCMCVCVCVRVSDCRRDVEHSGISMQLCKRGKQPLPLSANP